MTSRTCDIQNCKRWFSILYKRNTKCQYYCKVGAAENAYIIPLQNLRVGFCFRVRQITTEATECYFKLSHKISN
jgi:hypothetical protein